MIRGLSLPYRVHNVYVTAAIATIGGMLFGVDISSVSAFVSEEHYVKYFNNPSAQVQSGITGAMPGGSFIGCFFAGIICDRFGRKFVIQLASWIWIIGAAIQSSSQNVGQLIAGRFIAGWAIGLASSQTPVWIAELSPKKKRGMIVGIFQLAVSLGILIMFYVSFGCSKINGTAGFRLAWGLQIVPGLLLFLGTLILEESPRWLASKDLWEEALSVIANVNAQGHIDNADVRTEIAEIKDAIRIGKEKSGFRELFNSRVNCRRTFVGIMTQVWQQLCGMNVMMYFVVKVFTMSGFSSSASTTVVASSIQYVIMVVLTFLSLFIIDKVGRRPLLLVGAIMMMTWLWASAGMFATYSVKTGPEGYVPPDQPNAPPDDSVRMIIPGNQKSASRAIIAISYLFVASFSPTWGPGGWVYCSELFPMEQRAIGNSVTAGSNWIFNFALCMFTLPAFKNITWRTYCIFATFCFVMTVHVFLQFPETKGKTLEEIGMMWEAEIPAWRTANWKPDLPEIEALEAADSIKGGHVEHHDLDSETSKASYDKV